ncbi:N-formylglutamate amidohydrolase [Enhygromyxa salina]|uniref:N-formylglutamate amidohydrolase n=1 Tax=Enhygromyxa salina TaxID=215803 RepID=A0A2S9XW85_9BACT|nr:N-formylglutamate amidohydrolase [Enhygromyxa salina]
MIRNRGVVWRYAVGNIPLLTTLTHAQFSARIEQFHRPYYRALELLIERRRRQFGYAVVLDAHSMPGTVPGDLVLGTCSGSACDTSLVASAMAALSGRSRKVHAQFGSRWPLSVAIDDPYQGGNIAGTFGRPNDRVHALQLEVSRSLYMDEYRLDPRPVPDPRELAPIRGARSGRYAVHAPGRKGQSAGRERRRLLALVVAIDALTMELSLQRDALADRSAAE